MENIKLLYIKRNCYLVKRLPSLQKKKILAKCPSDWGLTCRIEKELKILDIKKPSNLVIKCSMILNSELLKGKIQMTSECLQSFQHPQLHGEIKMKTTLKLCLIPVKIAIIRNQTIILARIWGNGLLFLFFRSINQCGIFGNQHSQECKNMSADPSIPLLVTYLDFCILIYRYLSNNVH